LSLPNSHEALLRVRDQLSGRVALIGISEPSLLGQLPGSGLAMTDQWGCYSRMAESGPWERVFGYPAAPVAEPVSTAVVFLAKSKAEIVWRLKLAVSWLGEGGSILLIGEKREGIASAARLLADIAPSPGKIDSARHCQVWRAPVGSSRPPFDPDQALRWLEDTVAGVPLRIAQLPGTFSADRIDDGTRLLLESLDSSFGQSQLRGPVLDFACGCGVIGAWLGQRQPGLVVDGVDSQAQAVEAARLTYQAADIAGSIMPSDGLSDVSGRYGLVVSNPPFHTGVKTDYSVASEFFSRLRSHLQPGGRLVLVANRFLPYPDLIKTALGNCITLAENKRFCVYQSQI